MSDEAAVCTIGPKVMLKPGKTFALKAAKFEAGPEAAAAGGFDYPTVLVGTSTWKGSDGKPVNVYYEPSTGANGLAVAKFVLAHIDDLMASCDVWFGVRGKGGNVIMAALDGATDGSAGAYHYGCDFSSGGDWYADVDVAKPLTSLGLVMAEVTESYMGLQGKGWNCGGSGGEALSRLMAEIATGGANGAMSDYASGPSYDGSDWIDKDQGTDQDYPSIGCGILYLWWMLKQGYTVQQITQAGEPGGVLAGNWAALTGKPASQALAAFKAAVASVGHITGDDPFGAANPPYPATGTPVPPPPPPPPPPPVPGPSKFRVVTTTTTDFPGTAVGTSGVSTVVSKIVALPATAEEVTALAAQLGLAEAMPAKIKSALSSTEWIVAEVLMIDLPRVWTKRIGWDQVLLDVEAALAGGGFPKTG